MVKNNTDQDNTPSGATTPGPHRWRPGESGNPRGRPRKGSALTDAIRAKVDPTELVDIAMKLARDGEAESTRLQALAWLRDSGYLRPAERHEVIARTGTPDHDDEAALDALTTDQLRALLEAERDFAARRALILDAALDDPTPRTGVILDAVIVEPERLALPQPSVGPDWVSTTTG